MKRAHFFSSARLLGLVLGMTTIIGLLTGCGDDRIMNGVVYNQREYFLNSWDPKNHTQVFGLKPEQNFSARLKGSQEYEFKAWLEDGTVTDDFTARLDEKHDNAPYHDSKLDWAWYIGGPFFACLAPRNPEDDQSCVTQVTLESLEGFPAPPPVIYVTPEQLDLLTSTSPKQEADKQRLFKFLLHVHGLDEK
mgnify:CR=1 FL=1